MSEIGCEWVRAHARVYAQECKGARAHQRTLVNLRAQGGARVCVVRAGCTGVHPSESAWVCTGVRARAGARYSVKSTDILRTDTSPTDAQTMKGFSDAAPGQDELARA